MGPTPLLNPGRDPTGDSSMATALAFVCSKEFTGWKCNKCDWRFPVDPNLVFTDARAEEVVTAFDEHRCGDRARLPHATRDTARFHIATHDNS